MPKGHKRTKGVPELHDELKTRINLSLTPSAVEGLDDMATQLGVSRSELVERIGRRELLLPSRIDLGYVAPDVYTFMQNVIRASSEIDLWLSPVSSLPFRERNKLPSSPGAYLFSEWDYSFYGIVHNLNEYLTNDRSFINLEFLADKLYKQGFILWQSFKEFKASEVEKFDYRDLSNVYDNLRKVVFSEVFQKSTENSQTDDSNLQNKS